MLPFDFSGAPVPTDALVVTIPAGIRRKRALLGILARELYFPGYFGWNWDALSDCLRDFHWLTPRTVVLQHRDVPFAPGTPMRATYLEILREAAASWKEGETHRLIVTFPTSARAEVEKALDTPAS
jgi:hypothetical protein